MNKSFKEFVAFFRKDTYVVTDNFLRQVIDLVDNTTEKIDDSNATKDFDRQEFKKLFHITMKLKERVMKLEDNVNKLTTMVSEEDFDKHAEKFDVGKVKYHNLV